MTLPASYRNDRVGDGTTTIFPYTFKVWAAEEMRVVLTDPDTGVVTEPTSGFSVTGVGSDGGNVVFDVAPVADTAIVFLPTAEYSQDTDLVNETQFFQERIEDGLDKLCRQTQLVREELDRCVKTPVNGEAPTDITYPEAGVDQYVMAYDSATGEIAWDATYARVGEDNAFVGDNSFSQPVTLGAGDAAAPSLDIGGTNDGFYRPSTGVIGLSISGTSRFLFSGTSSVLNQNAAVLGTGGVAGIGSGFEVFSADGGNALNTLTTFAGSSQMILRKANGTGATPTATTVGSVLGQVGFRGYGATGWATTNRAFVSCMATENWTDSAHGCRISIYGTPTGSTATGEIARFDSGGSTMYTPLNVRSASAIRSEAAAGQDAVVLAGRAGGTSSYAATIIPPTLSSSIQITLPDRSCTIAGTNGPQTFGGNQTFLGKISCEDTITSAYDTFDSISMQHGSSGTGSHVVQLRPGTLSGTRIVSFPDADGTVPVKAAAVPATATSAGVVGQIAFDANYAYFCHAANTWRRVATSSW